LIDFQTRGVELSHEKTLPTETVRGLLLRLRFMIFISSLQAVIRSLGVAVLLSSTSTIAERMIFRFDLTTKLL
jgi:hypothetical protein